MTDHSPNEPHVIATAVVRDSLRRLSALQTHKAFPGYLVLLYSAREAGRLDNLRPKFKPFFDQFFSVGETSAKWPYYVPFGPADRPEERFFNRNVAGSYAPSSLREVSPLRQLATIVSAPSGHLYSLVDGHAQVAADLLDGLKLPGASLAAYIYRDFSFTGSPELSPADIYAVFKADFGFAFPSGSLVFEDLFEDDTSALGSDPFVALGAQ